MNWTKAALFISGIFLCCEVTPADIRQDHNLPTVFYNAQAFPEGLFDSNGQSRLSDEGCFVAFDLNDVVFLRDYSVLWTEIKRISYEQGIWAGLQIPYAFASCVIHKKYLCSYCKNPDGCLWDRYLDSLLQKAQTEKNKDLIRTLRLIIQKLNTLNMPVIAALQTLNQRGHTTAALTNMGIHFLTIQKDLLLQKLQNGDLPEQERNAIKTTFDLLANERTVMPCPENGWCLKPDPEMYQNCLDKNRDHTGYFIFVDDKLSNTQAALRNGFQLVILFTNAQEFTKTLRALGLI